MPLSKLIASGFGSGLLTKAPGTVGTVACVVFWYVFYLTNPVVWTTTLVFALFSIAAGTIATSACIGDQLEKAEESGTHVDPGWIVIDEWAGMFIALLFCTPDQPAKVLAAFVLFRAFDISKWGPVKRAENLGGATGIMADDVVAGALALVCVEAMTTFWRAIVA